MSDIPLTIVSGVIPCSVVVGPLNLATAIGLADGGSHRGGLLIGVHQHRAVDVTGGTPDRLDQRGLTAEEPLLIGVKDPDERHLRQVQTLTQKVDSDQHVVFAQAQVADDLDPFQRVDLRVQIPDA